MKHKEVAKKLEVVEARLDLLTLNTDSIYLSILENMRVQHNHLGRFAEKVANKQDWFIPQKIRGVRSCRRNVNY